jgi:filamentous hemagglutinin
MATLPGAHQAVIGPDKLRDYVLSPDHELGRHKARVFASALGIDRRDWEYLHAQIASRLADAEVSEVRTGSYGVRYSVPMLIEGLNGQTHEVTTGWIIEKEGAPPRFLTAYVNVP